MAFGLECDRCGYVETAHGFTAEYPGACHHYVSPQVVDLPLERRTGRRRPLAPARPAAVISLAARKQAKSTSVA